MSLTVSSVRPVARFNPRPVARPAFASAPKVPASLLDTRTPLDTAIILTPAPLDEMATMTQRLQALLLRMAGQPSEAARNVMAQQGADLAGDMLKLHQKSVTVDKLTGLSNQAEINRLFAHRFKGVQKYQKPLSVFLIDLDEFKGVNDKYGHLVGDDVLRATGSALKNLMRDSDLIGRDGGEEVMLLPHQHNDLERTQSDAMIISERLIRQMPGEIARLLYDRATELEGENDMAQAARIRELIVDPERNKGRGITASIGVYVATPKVGETSGAFKAKADMALYEAKGKNSRTGTGRARACIVIEDAAPQWVLAAPAGTR